MTVHAMTAEELYQFYGEPYTPLYREEDLETIQNYNFAKQYLNKYRYVASSEYDDKILLSREEKYQSDMEHAEQILANGFYLSLSEIYEAEANYAYAKAKLEETRDALDTTYMLDETKSLPTNVPSYQDYVQAVSNKRLVDMANDLGSAETLSILSGPHLVDDWDDHTVTYSTLELSLVTSLFNGYVTGVTEDTVTVNHYNNIISYYKGLTPSVQVGDEVKQGSLLGYSYDRVHLRLRINDELVDVYKLLEEQ